MKKSKNPRQFASDNCAGVCPEAWNALKEANAGHAAGYGDDEWTRQAADKIREVFETQCEVFFVFNGTAANSLALASLCQSYHSILCHEYAHVERDECGAPEFFSNGTKVLLLPGENGKIRPEAIEECVKRRTDIHYPKPKAVSVTQSTELGTVYSADELQAIGEQAKRWKLKLHMDGARFANAVASLNAAPKEITWQAGVDVLCFGGTKNGTLVGDAVVFFDRKLAAEFDYRCKQAGQLASKMRYLAAPWVGMLQNEVWLKHAGRANATARQLRNGLRQLTGLKLLFPTQANAVFVEMPQTAIHALRQKGWQFYTFVGKGGCRLMCSWDTTQEDVQNFLQDLNDALRSPTKQQEQNNLTETKSKKYGRSFQN